MKSYEFRVTLVPRDTSGCLDEAEAIHCCMDCDSRDLVAPQFLPKHLPALVTKAKDLALEQESKS